MHQSRVLPDTPQELIEYFLDTEAQEIEFEIARTRQRLVFYEFRNCILPVVNLFLVSRLEFLFSAYIRALFILLFVASITL